VFVEILKRVPPKTTHTVEQIPVTIEEQSEYILEVLAQRERVLFTELLEKVDERIVLIVTFVAILELVKNDKLRLNQSKPFSEIWIVKFDGS
jgi:segregation and condensation protein A